MCVVVLVCVCDLLYFVCGRCISGCVCLTVFVCVGCDVLRGAVWFAFRCLCLVIVCFKMCAVSLFLWLCVMLHGCVLVCVSSCLCFVRLFCVFLCVCLDVVVQCVCGLVCVMWYGLMLCALCG